MSELHRPEPWKDGRLPKVTCSARRTNGDPCKRPPIKGATVCRAHGGAAPQVRAKAQVRLLMASDLAAKKLIELMSSAKVPDAVKLTAARDLLDRANVVGTQQVEIRAEVQSWERTMQEVVVNYSELGGDDEAAEDIVNAEVVDEGDEAFAARLSEMTESEQRAAQRERRLKPRAPRRTAPAESTRAHKSQKPMEGETPAWFDPAPFQSRATAKRRKRT